MRWILIITLISAAIAGGAWWWFATYRSPAQTETVVPDTGVSLFGNLIKRSRPTDSAPPVLKEGQRIGVSALEEITAVPVAGFGISRQGSTTIIRYVERETGHVYEARYPGGTLARISNTTIPRVREAAFDRGLSTIMLRYLAEDDRTIETFVGRVASTTDGAGELVGSFMPENILAAAFSPTGSDMAYLERGPSGATLAVGKAGTVGKVVWTSPLSEWLLQWTASGITLSTKPSFMAAGYAYRFSLDSRTLSEVVGPVSGLSVLPSESNALIYAGSDLSLRFLSGGKTNQLGPRTFPEKCAWGASTLFCAVPRSIPRGTYPDAWLQAVVSFSDDLWKIDTRNGATDLVRAFEADVPLDAIELRAAGDDAVFFMNKRDRSLWVARVGN